MKLSHSNNFLKVPIRLTILKIILLFVFIGVFPFIANAQKTFRLNSGSTVDKYFTTPRLATAFLTSNTLSDESNFKENRCLKTGRWIGAISGSTMGLLHIYWSATGVSGIHGSFEKNLITGIPSAVIGAYVGAKTTEWVTRQIMKGNPKPAKAALKGMAYGAIDGIITLSSSLIPLFIIGHYTNTIHFNLSDDLIILKLIGISAIGGTVYGGTIGATMGVVYGPCISLYMKF